MIIDAAGQNSSHPHEIRSIKSIEEVRRSIQNAHHLNKKITLFGTKHSQAGQICHNGAIALDMNAYNRVVHLNLNEKHITVESGIQWKVIQEVIHPFGLSLQIMQFVNTFTVGGSMSANIFSRDPRRSRLIEVIVSFTLITASGDILKCSREDNYELFTLVIEGHGLFGVIAEVTIQLIENTFLVSETYIYSSDEYLKTVSQTKSVYHQAEYIIDDMEQIIATDYYETKSKTKETRHDIMTINREADLTFWDPAGSDALIGFFIPITSFSTFETNIRSIIQNSSLNIFKCSTNYLPDHQESFLSPILGPCMKFAIFYRHDLEADALKEACADATFKAKGAPYLTFDFTATSIQMNAFYPRWRAFLERKRHYDSKEIFYNQFYKKLLDIY